MMKSLGTPEASVAGAGCWFYVDSDDSLPSEGAYESEAARLHTLLKEEQVGV